MMRSDGPARAVALTTLGQGVVQVLSVAATVALARLLDPRDFGIVAGIGSVMAVASLLLSVGFATAIMRASRVNRREQSSLFWAAVAAGALFTAVIAALAPPLGRQLGDAFPPAMLMVAAVALALSTCGAIPQAIASREGKFGKVLLIQSVSTTIYAITQVALAANGFGAWSVILGQVVLGASTLAVGCAVARWLPTMEFDIAYLRGEVHFAAGMFVNQGAGTLGKTVDNLAIGATLGAGPLGLYYIAYTLPNIVRMRVSWAVSQVTLPVFARLRDDTSRLAHAYGRAIALQFFIASPLLAGTAILSDPLIRIFFGDRWAPASSPMSVLAVAAQIDLLCATTGTLAIALGRVLRNGVAVLAKVAVVGGGVWWVASTSGDLTHISAVVLAAVVIGALAQHAVLPREFSSAIGHEWRILTRMGFCVLLMTLTVLTFAISAQQWSPAALLATGVPLGCLAYGLPAWVLCREEFRLVQRTITDLMRRRRVVSHGG